MDRNEAKIRGRLARAKGGHRRNLQAKLDDIMRQRGPVEAPVVEVAAPVVKATAPAKKKKTVKKKSD